MKQITLMYHDVYAKDVKESGFDTPGAIHYKISEDVFIEHIEAISNYCASKGINKDDIVFTFDDGGVSFYTIIAPILEKYGWKGHFFISTKYIGTDGFLTGNQIKELSRRGHIIGSHSHRHKVLTEFSVNDIENELCTSVKILSDILEKPIDSISIPNGCYNKEILNIVHKNELRTVYTSNPTSLIKRIESMILVGRYAVVYNTKAEDVISILSSSFLRFRMKFKYQILQIVKQLLGTYYSKIKMAIRKNFIK